MAVAAVVVAGGEPATPAWWQRRPAAVGLIVGGVALFFAANDWCAVAGGGGWQSSSSTLFLVGFPTVLSAAVAMVLLGLLSVADRQAAAGRASSQWWATWPARGLYAVGVISYSLYLYHVGVQFFVFRLDLFPSASFHTRAAVNAAVALIPAVAVSAGLYHAVERPSLRWVARIRGRRPANLVTTAATSEPREPIAGTADLIGP